MTEDDTSTEIGATLDLEQQLQSAVKLATDLKQENATLTRDLKDAREFSRSTAERNAEMRECRKKELELVEKREKKLVLEESKWKQRLEERKHELEELERKYENILDRNVSSGHSEAMKQLENDYSSKLSRLEEETTKWRQSYYEARQDSEQLKAKCDECMNQVQLEQATSDSLQKAIKSLQESFVHHIESRTEKDTNDLENNLTRDLKRQLNERDLALSSLQEQIKVLQKERDDSITSKDLMIGLHHSEINALKQVQAELESKNNKLQRRIVSSEKTMNDAEKCKEELEERLSQTTKEVNRLQNCLRSLEGAHETTCKKLRSDLTQSKAKSSKQLSSLRQLITEEQEKSKTLQQRCSEIQQHAMKHINELAKSLENHDDSAEKLLIAKDEIIQLENAVTHLQDEKLQINRDHDAECHRLQHAIESLHHEIGLRTIEANEITKAYDAERTKTKQLQNNLVSSEASLKKMEQKCQLLEEEKRKLSTVIDDLKREKDSFKSKLETLSNNATQARAEVDEMKEKFTKEKRRSGAYKEKALEAHRRSLEAKELLDSIYHQK